MSTKSDLLNLLSKNANEFMSGQEIADGLGLSRNAVWKAVKSLQSQGYPLESLSGVGYRLKEKTDVISLDYLEKNTNFPCKYYVLDSVDSTNNYAKKIGNSDLIQIIVSNEQTAGRGRLGRSFFSPLGKGIYMTIAFKPDFDLDKSMLITTMTSVVLCRALENVAGIHPKIKWVNDVYLGEKKLCGILTEAESNFETGKIDRLLVGIGINCFESELPSEIKNIAGYITNPLKDFSRNQLITAVANEFFETITHFDREKIIRQYKSLSFILGNKILIINPAIAANLGMSKEKGVEGIKARAIDVDENGGLVVEYLEGRRSREMDTLTTGEVSIRKI